MVTDTIYHCLYKEPEGDALLATCDREVNGQTGHYLFAATHLSKALAFAFSYHDGEVICNEGIHGTDDEVVIICGGQETLDKPRNIQVRKFSSEGFEEIKGARQCVSRSPMPFKDTEIALQTASIEDLMRSGLQIFLMEERADELVEQGFLDQFDKCSLAEMLRTLQDQKRVRWINADQRINPNKILGFRIWQAGADQLAHPATEL